MTRPPRARSGARPSRSGGAWCLPPRSASQQKLPQRLSGSCRSVRRLRQRADVDVRGHILARPDLRAGRTDLDATSFGAYWSHIAPSGWYTDAVVTGTIYDGDGHSFGGSNVGTALAAAVRSSLGSGFPLLKMWGMTLEQQGQLVYQYINLDEANDPYSHVAHSTPDALHGRIAWRLSANGLPWPIKPFLKANLWQDFAGKDSATYAHTHEIVTRQRSTTLELGAASWPTSRPTRGCGQPPTTPPTSAVPSRSARPCAAPQACASPGSVTDLLPFPLRVVSAPAMRPIAGAFTWNAPSNGRDACTREEPAS